MSQVHDDKESPDNVISEHFTMTLLMSELAKHQANLRGDMATLILDSITFLQFSVDALHKIVSAFQTHITLTQGENFEQPQSQSCKVKTPPC